MKTKIGLDALVLVILLAGKKMRMLIFHGFVLLLAFALLSHAGTVSAAPGKSRIGLRFEHWDFPVAMKDCSDNSRHFSETPFEEDGKILFISQYHCAGVDQFWLMRRVDRRGNTLSPRDLAYSPDDINKPRIYVVEDIFLLSRISKPARPFSQCSGPGFNEGNRVAGTTSAFAVGIPVPTYIKGDKENQGYIAEKISEAWKVDLATRKFARMATKGIDCDERH